MNDDLSNELLAYHEATKHHFRKFAKSSGIMDWANQPEPLRTFEGTSSIPLLLLGKDPDAAHEDFYARKTNPVAPFSLENNGGFLELSMGMSGWKGNPGGRWSLRINLSSGNLQQTEGTLGAFSYGHLGKWPFHPISALNENILSSEYQLQACGKRFSFALILNGNSNFSRQPYERPRIGGLVAA